MEIGKIFMLVAVVFAMIAGIISVPHAAAVIAVLGLVCGAFIRAQEGVYFLVCAVALSFAYGALDPTPQVGGYLSDMLARLSALFNAAACTVIVRLAIRRLRPQRPEVLESH